MMFQENFIDFFLIFAGPEAGQVSVVVPDTMRHAAEFAIRRPHRPRH